MRNHSFSGKVTIRTKLLSVFLAAVLIPIIIFGFFTVRSSNTALENEASETYTQMTKQIAMIFSEYISRVDQTTRMVDNTAAVPEYLRNKFTEFETDPAAVALLEQRAREALELVARTNEDMYSLIVTSLDGESISYTDGKFDRPAFSIDEDYYAPLKSSTGDTVLLPVRTSSYEFSADARVFSVACRHLDVSFENSTGLNMYTGYVISECPVSAFADICAASNFGKGTILYIFDSENKPVYTTDSSDGISKSLLSNMKSHGKTEINGKEYLPVSSAVANTGWSVVAAVPYNFITASAQTLLNRLVTLSLICAAVIIIITAAVSFYFTRPIKVLQLSMKQLSGGDLETRISQKRKDEFGDLFDNFNSLAGELNNLIYAVSESEKRETEAKYRMLQSQINPHFLYNSLDTIRMMAVLDDKNDIAEALLNLSALFRYHIRNSDKPVTVKEELSQIKNYLSLQQLRLQEKLEIVYDTDEEALSCYMPKILLQPILENCFSHGFKDISHKLVISVTIKKEGRDISFTVADNGRGMTIDELDRLAEKLSRRDMPSEHGIGLYNVNERLRLYFSDNRGLIIQSRENEGMSVSFTIPASLDSSAVYQFKKPKKED